MGWPLQIVVRDGWPPAPTGRRCSRHPCETFRSVISTARLSAADPAEPDRRRLPLVDRGRIVAGWDTVHGVVGGRSIEGDDRVAVDPKQELVIHIGEAQPVATRAADLRRRLGGETVDAFDRQRGVAGRQVDSRTGSACRPRPGRTVAGPGLPDHDVALDHQVSDPMQTPFRAGELT